MAEKTTSEQIADLDSQITALETSISEMQIIKEQEEGSVNSRFKTSFQNINDLYARLDSLKARRRILRMGQKC